MQQYTTFNLPVCMAVEDHAFMISDEIIKRYIPEIIGQKALLVTGPSLIESHRDRITEISCDFGNAEITVIRGATFDEAIRIAKKVYIDDIKVVIGIGGGRVLDTAKYAAHISQSVYICMSTSLSNDSLASPFSVLEYEGNIRKTIACKIPTAIIVDTDIVANAPIEYTKSGIGDTIAKYTSLFDWKLSAKKSSTNVDDFAYMIVKMSYDSVYHCDENDIKSYEFIRILSRALVMSGLAMEIAKSPRPCSGSEHLFSHALEEYYPELKISHGLSVALGIIPACIFQGQSPDGIIKFFHSFGINLNPRNYGITEDMFCDMWEKASTVRKGRITILTDVKPDRRRLHEIYHLMMEH